METAVHWLHLMAAIIWVGGTLLASLVVVPALREGLDDSARMKVYAAIGRRLTRVQWWAWATLAGTGAWKLWQLRGASSVFGGAFGLILGAKLTLVSAMVALSLLHSFKWGPALTAGGLHPSERAALARRTAFWGKVNGLVMMAIVFCAALLRFNPW